MFYEVSIVTLTQFLGVLVETKIFAKHNIFSLTLYFLLNSQCRLHFFSRRICYDALARVGTVAAVQIIKDSVNNGIMSKYLQRIMFGIGWVRDLNSEYIKTAMVRTD